MERSVICRKAIQIFGLSLVLMTAETARGAITVFDTFGVGNAYDTGTRYGVDGNTAFQAFLFVPTSSGTLSDITVALGRSSALTLFTQFNLYAGTPTALGALLESNVVPNSVPVGLTPGQVVNFSSVVQPLLIAGQNYWLSFTEPNAADGSTSFWFFNSQATFGTRLTNLLPAATAANPAFRISVNPVPEPNFLPVMLSSMVGFFLVHRYRKPLAD